MNILVSLDSNYIKQVKVMLTSFQIENHNEEFYVYVLNSKLTSGDIENIKRCADINRTKIFDIKVPDSMFTNVPITDRYPREMYFRIFAAKLLPDNLDRILYLDPDLVIINSLNEFYNMDLKDMYYAGATHIGKPITKLNEVRLNMPPECEYINSGVLLMNLKALRREQNEEEVTEYIKKNSIRLYLPDQDVINGLYGDKIICVSEKKYNFGERDFIKTKYLSINGEKIDMKWIVNNACIIHYYGRNKPWKEDYIGDLDVFYHIYEKRLRQFEEIGCHII